MDETKLVRILELAMERDKINEELAALMGGQPTKRKWTRRQPEPEQPQA